MHYWSENDISCVVDAIWNIQIKIHYRIFKILFTVQQCIKIVKEIPFDTFKLPRLLITKKFIYRKSQDKI